MQLQLFETPTQPKDSDQWFTPPEIIERVRTVFGGDIDLDPATCRYANETVGAKTFYTAEDDGLSKVWGKDFTQETMFLNPPYSKPMPWIAKTMWHVQHGDLKHAILFVKCDPSTRWFSLLWDFCNAICFPGRRIKHYSNVNKQSTPDFAQAIAYAGPLAWRFADVFGEIGTVTLVWSHHA